MSAINVLDRRSLELGARPDPFLKDKRAVRELVQKAVERGWATRPEPKKPAAGQPAGPK